ncbi:MAG: DinB family protein [Ilumatobacteraceae bacterium]
MEIVDNDLTGLRFRGAEAVGLEIDSPWLIEAGGPLLVNGVDVVPFVDAELNRRFPGRELRRADTPAGLQAAWGAAEATWATTVARAEAMPAGTLDVSVAGEWTFAETLRHLVMATDVWLRKAILGVADPYHPVGRPNGEFDRDGFDGSVFSNRTPTWAEVLEARADRQVMVRQFIAAATPEQLSETRTNPWAPQHEETVLSCLHTILEEEWEHHRYAVRDLDSLPA